MIAPSPEKAWGGALHPIDFSWCVDTIRVPELIPGLAKGEVCILSAPGGTGKSFFLLEAALGFAGGRPTVFSQTGTERPMKTLYVGFQDSEVRLHNRLASIRRAFPAAARAAIAEGTLEVSFYKGPRPALVVQGQVQPQAVDELRRLCTGREILIIDPLSKIHFCNENDNLQMDVLTDVLCSVAEETGCAIFLSHHSGKGEVMDSDGKKKKGLNSRGASSVIDGVRLGLYLVPEEPERGTGRLSLRWPKINNGQRPEPIKYRHWYGLILPTWWEKTRGDADDEIRAPWEADEKLWEAISREKLDAEIAY
jgi:RecA-family ATPase